MTLSRRESALLRALATRAGRRKHALCRCEGVRAVRELLAFHPEGVRFIAATGRGAAACGVPLPELRMAEEREFAEIADTVNSQGVIAVAAIPEERSDSIRGDFLLALDGIGDPGNFGTIVRACRAAGVFDLWYTKGSVDPWCDKAVRAGMGAQFGLALRRFDDAETLIAAAAGFGCDRIFYADPHGGESCFTARTLFDRSVLFIGGEPNGSAFAPGTVRSVTIPMPGGYESINAAQAATVLLFESVRRKMENTPSS